jgi:hypothetical protein
MPILQPHTNVPEKKKYCSHNAYGQQRKVQCMEAGRDSIHNKCLRVMRNGTDVARDDQHKMQK